MANTTSDLTMVSELSDGRMQLRPVDFALLQELKKGRNLAANLYMDLDVSRQYVNQRLTLLEDYGLVDRVGPNPRAGLYEINKKGRVAADHRDVYKDDTVDFEEFLRGQIDADSH